MKRSALIISVVIICAWSCGVYAQSGKDIGKSIVKIYAIQTSPDYYSPWSMRTPISVTGSGCVIKDKKGKKILTNAHVVSDQTFIQVRGYGDSKRFQAKVINVSHAADLALLTVNDPEFWKDVEPLEFDSLPAPQQEVLVYGFPMGGDSLSITKGTVSRVEQQSYTHSSMNLLAIQIDAAVNPGNSGGPAMVGDKIVGVVMQEISGASNLGYLIPVTVIRHFLTDLEDGHYDGIPSLGIDIQNMDSPAMKQKYQVSDKRNGALITGVVPGSPADGQMQAGDVLLAVDGHPVADDCAVEFRPNERTFLIYVTQLHQIGESLNVDILRGGKKISRVIPLTRPNEKDRLIPLEQFDRLPSYYVYGGLVFSPLTADLLMAWGDNWINTAPKEMLALLADNRQAKNINQVVVLMRVLPADVNEGYHEVSSLIVSEVNGENIRNLEDLIRVIEEKTSGQFVTFKNAHGSELVLDRDKAEAEKQAILTTYRIPSDRSPDLQKK